MPALQPSPWAEHAVSAAEHQLLSTRRTSAFTASASAASPACPSGKNKEIFKGGLQKKKKNKQQKNNRQPNPATHTLTQLPSQLIMILHTPYPT